MAFSCLPFGHGVRMCIGRRIAEEQVLLLLSRILQNWQVSSNHPVQYVTRMVGVPDSKPDIELSSWKNVSKKSVKA